MQADSLPAELSGNYSAIKKKNRIIPSAVTWMDLETVIPGEVSLTEKDNRILPGKQKDTMFV